MSARLDRLLRPQSIAVIGGGRWCENVIRQARLFGYDGQIWPVHPTKPAVASVAAFAHIGDLPGAPDAAFVGINRSATIGAVGELARRGAGGAVCFASGFLEAQPQAGDGGELQEQLLQAAGDMPILGPNCYGFINYLDGALLWPDQHGGVRVEKGVAIVTQSSNIAINITMQARALPLAYIVTAGNQAQNTISDIGAALLADPRVTALGLHIEGIGDLAAFEALAAAAHGLRKPVIVLKVGKSGPARAATITHTASMAGDEAAADALFRRLGLGRASSLAAFLEALKLAHVTGPLASNRIASMSCSGGEASLVADCAEPHGLRFPPLDQRQKDTLSEILGPMVRLANPLDYNTYIWGDRDKLAATFGAMMQGELAIGVVILDFPRADRCNDADWAHAVAACQRAAEVSGKPMAILASMSETMPEVWAQRIIDCGLLALGGMDEGLEALAIGARLGEFSGIAAPVMKPRATGKTITIGEAQAKQMLARHGLVVPRSKIADTPQRAGQAAEELGYPVVLKAIGLAHKTEARAVRIGLDSTTAVRDAESELDSASYLIEEMVAGGVAEVLIGITCDPAHGYLLTLGAGGDLTEIHADTRHLLVPASPADIEAALMGLRMAPVLTGYRSRPAADIGAIVDAAMAVQDCVVAAAGKIVEAEVNPLIAKPSGAVAVDALICMEEDDG